MPRKTRIEYLLREALSPLHLEVQDESHMHGVPAGTQSHFRVTAVSGRFAGQSLLARQRLVNALLRDDFQTGLYALALHTLTPEEWFAKGGQTPASPPCLGGSKASQPFGLDNAPL